MIVKEIACPAMIKDRGLQVGARQKTPRQAMPAAVGAHWK